MLCWPELGSPEALRKVVRVMPSWRALRVIRLAKRDSLPPNPSPRTTATSFADLMTIAWIASSTRMEEPARRPSRVGGMLAARADTRSGVRSPMR